MSTPDYQKGAPALQNYLAENEFDFHQLSRREFRHWLAGELERKKKDPVVAKRLEIRETKRRHLDRYQKLKERVKKAEKNWEKSEYREKIEGLEQELHGAEKAIAGLTGAIEEESSSHKKDKMVSKRDFFRDKREKVLRDLEFYKEKAPEKVELENARAQWEKFRQEVSLVTKEEELAELNRKRGTQTGAKGNRMEDRVRGLIEGPVFNQVRGGSEKKEDFRFLTGVTLGCARAEFDYLIIKVLSQDKNGVWEVEVRALVEVKRNINDLAWGFQVRQENLAWFVGDKERYEAEAYWTNVFTKGHFDRPALHREGGEEFRFCRQSFRHFEVDPRVDYYLDGLFFITRPRPLMGMSNSEYSHILYRATTDVEFDLDDEEYMRKLYDWSMAKVDSFQTRQVIEIYLEVPEKGDQFYLIDS